jgi:tellurite resistance protein TerA
MTDNNSSANAMIEATRGRAKFSGHGGALGAAGYLSDTDDNNVNFLGVTGQTEIVNPHQHGYEKIRIGAAWQPITVKKQGFLGKLLKKEQEKGVDLDLGCLYEMKDGTRGCVQAFGEMFGAFNEAPYLSLSGDDRTGEDDDDDDGEDEIIMLNGKKWPDIKRVLFYLYIYEGVNNWAEIQPQVQIRVPNEKPMIVTLHTYKSELPLCAVAMLENVRGGIKMTNNTEYYPGHAEMDRAFGFGLNWDDGKKS